MAKGIKLELNHAGIEEIEDSYAEKAMEFAEDVKRRADGMRSNPYVAEFQTDFEHGRKLGRRYAYVYAAAPSTRADNARNNILAKAMSYSKTSGAMG